jgi:hypothetical protein
MLTYVGVQAVVHMQYDVRGMVPSVAEVISQELKDGRSSRPYEKVFFCVLTYAV